MNKKIVVFILLVVFIVSLLPDVFAISREQYNKLYKKDKVEKSQKEVVEDYKKSISQKKQKLDTMRELIYKRLAPEILTKTLTLLDNKKNNSNDTINSSGIKSERYHAMKRVQERFRERRKASMPIRIGK